MEVETKQKFVISFTLIMLLELTALITIYYGGLLGLIVDEQGILTYSFFVLQFVTQVVLFIFLIIQYLIDEISEKYKKFMNFMEAITCISYLISTYYCILCITKYLLLQLVKLITFTLQQNLLITFLLISFIIQLINAQTYLLFKHTTISARFVGTIQLYISLYIQQLFVIIDVAFLIFYLTFFKALVQFNQIMPVYKSMLIIVSEVQLYIIIMQGLNFKTFIGYGARQVKYLTLHIKIFEGAMIGFVTYVYIIKQIFGFNVFILFNLILINYTYVRLLLLGKSSPDKDEKLQNLIQIATVECQKCGHQIGVDDYIQIWRNDQDITVYHQDCYPSRINGAHSVYDQLQLRTILNQKDNIQSKKEKVNIKFILILYSIICLAILSYIYYSVNYIYVDTPIYQKKTKFYYFYRIYHTKLYLFCTYCALWILTIIYMAFEFSNPGIKMFISIISTMILLYTYGQLMIYMNQNNMRIKFQSQYEYYNGTWFIMASLLSSSLFLKLGFFIDQNIEYLQYCINITVSFFTFCCLVIWFSMQSNSWEYFIKYIYLYFNLYTLIFDMCVLLYPDTQLQISRNKFLQNFYNFNYYLIMMAFVIGFYMMFFFFKVSAEEVSTAQCYYYTMAMITSRFLNIQIQKVNKILEERRKQQDRNIGMNDIRRYVQQQQVEVQNPQKILLQLSG